MIDPAAKLWSQPKAIAAFLVDDRSAPPVQVEVAPTNRCNARCPWCFYNAHSNKPPHTREELPWPVLRDCLDDLAQMGTQAVSWTGAGEPGIYSRFVQAVEYAARLGLRQGLFTNGYRLVAGIERFPQILVNVRVVEKRPIEEISSVCDAVQRVEKDLDGRGRVLIRYSGTEPKARVMVEGEDESRVDEYANEIAESLRRAIGGG